MEPATILLLASIVLFFAVIAISKAYLGMRSRLREALSGKQSLSTKYGRMTEQFMPFMDLYPYDSQNFRFIGSPIDGVQFNSDGIVFIEFKTASSGMTHGQRLVKEQVEAGKVRFREIRMPEPATRRQ